MSSIQNRLLALSMTAVLAVGLATVWLAHDRAVHEVDELVDAQLLQYARIMLALGGEGDDDEVEPPEIHGHRYTNRLIFQFWEHHDRATRLILRSPEAPPDWPAGVALEGYSNARIGATPWRCFSASDGKHLTLVGLDQEIRDELAQDIAWGNLKPYLIGLPLLAIVLAWVIRGGLAPLRRLDTEVSGRSPGRLDPLPEHGQPKELNPLVRAMNRLLDRMRQALDNERRFTSDAAHELRTPLAAMKAQLQVAQRSDDAGERLAAIAKALRGADRMTHLVSQLLALARLEGAGEALPRVPVAISDLATEVLAEASPGALEKGIDLSADIQLALVVDGNPELLRILSRNLVDNALRYTDAPGRVLLTLSSALDGVRLRVEDNGPGVHPDDLARLGRRFHRFGPRTQDGAGLGLSIATRVVALHHGRIDYGSGLDDRGLGVAVTLPNQFGAVLDTDSETPGACPF
jgi:two-component system, OmpR family, sensor histidine kinase QseC